MAIQIPAPRQEVTKADPRTGLTSFTRPWFLFFQGLLDFVTLGSRAASVAVTVGASPYSYTAPDFGTVAVTGGTVTLIELGRNGAFTDTGITAGLVPVSPSDIVRITYAVAPVVTFVRR